MSIQKTDLTFFSNDESQALLDRFKATPMEVLRDYAYVDFRGMGIRTKIIPLMKKFNHTEPVFEATEDYFKTVLPRKSVDG